VVRGKSQSPSWEVHGGAKADTGTDPGLPAWGSYSVVSVGTRGARDDWRGTTPPPLPGRDEVEGEAEIRIGYHGLRFVRLRRTSLHPSPRGYSPASRWDAKA